MQFLFDIKFYIDGITIDFHLWVKSPLTNTLLEIGDGAFRNCTGLTSMTIPDSVTKIGNGAFQNCTGLTSVTIPGDVTEIGNEAFQDCENLTIHAPAGSAAKKYAEKNGIKFEVTE